MLAEATQPPPLTRCPIHVLESVQERVLWLATSMIHHANHVRTTPSGLKVGGHQASSASMTSIMTSLYFDHLTAADQISVKPHASPVLHAINYLLGRLDRSYLERLREYGGLQSYPSRTKDPDPVDYSTGSVGLGATATLWSALAKRYLDEHGETSPGGRHIALIGDAELDEGAVWEAILDPQVPRLGEVMWVVDLNRQSLDRVVPDIAAGRIGKMFEAAGWQTIPVKYGRRLRAMFERPGGDALRDRIDSMPNEEYQSMLRSPSGEVRQRLLEHPSTRANLRHLLADESDADLAQLVRDLGGHDLQDLTDAYALAAATTDRPSVVFAYTIKAWRLPTEGHPANHSALLSGEAWEQLADTLHADHRDPWAEFDPGSPESELCARAAARLRRSPATAPLPLSVPPDLGRTHTPTSSTQQALGRIIVDIDRSAPELARRIVTVSPDVASSTNLGAWINRAGVWNVRDREDWFASDSDMLMKWRETRAGRHIELGIAETNLVGLLGELGATWSRWGTPLIPIGTVYDPFVTRALEPWSFGIYSGGQSILIGTPSGVTLSPEGGAHQSIITPSIGIEQPDCVGWEPAFAQDLEWAFLDAISNVGRPGGSSAYFRLSTRAINQSLAATPADGPAREQRRLDVLAGGYVISRAEQPALTLVGVGAVLPEVTSAARRLTELGVGVDVVCVTSPNLIFKALRARRGLRAGDDSILGRLFPPERARPMVTVLDGHPHSLAFLGTINRTAITTLGVDSFGQVGDIDDVYRHFGIDADTIVGASWDLLDEAER